MCVSYHFSSDYLTSSRVVFGSLSRIVRHIFSLHSHCAVNLPLVHIHVFRLSFVDFHSSSLQCISPASLLPVFMCGGQPVVFHLHADLHIIIFWPPLWFVFYTSFKVSLMPSDFFHSLLSSRSPWLCPVFCSHQSIIIIQLYYRLAVTHIRSVVCDS